jgi:hypothetical protein
MFGASLELRTFEITFSALVCGTPATVSPAEAADRMTSLIELPFIGRALLSRNNLLGVVWVAELFVARSGSEAVSELLANLIGTKPTLVFCAGCGKI